MSVLISNHRGGYDFLSGIAPYSGGVVARKGYEIVHVTLMGMLPWREGFDRIDEYLKAHDLGRECLCGVELRSPEPFSMEGFDDFNACYRAFLEEWELMVDGENPVARTNVVPFANAPEEVCLYAFSYTVPCADGGATFVVAGGGEVNGGLRDENIVCFGESSPDAMKEKAGFVMGLMDLRLKRLDVGWNRVTVTNVYTVHPLRDIVEKLVLPRMNSASLKGITWCYSHPPIVDIEFEMDLRGVVREEII